MQCLLHVDDEVATRQAVRQRLAPFYDVVCAESGREGREILQRSPVQLVILESRLSDGCGLELLGEIRRGDPRLPVIMVTRFGSESVCVAAFRLGASDYFPKPVDLGELLRSVRLLIAASWSHHRHLVGTLSLPHERPRSPLTPSTVPERSGRVQQAMQFIDEHYAEPLPLRRVAATAAMSRFAFSRAFTAVMGVQFRTYLLQLRIAKACPLLVDSSRSISDVAQVVGFTDLPRFDKVFKKQTGLSPSQYRWRHQPGATNDKK